MCGPVFLREETRFAETMPQLLRNVRCVRREQMQEDFQGLLR